ncbi:NAD+ diphosphatase [Paraoerskovia marina]|uniref:NAD(+) diphosphatase n=1 Tax=Paraoerskovia marina TaxID=545619 RepID=A0A1H1UW89_9CELL|nr:NAD(+) diphosphatase [Paraoerskovia marina]SDS76745.1 NAD+ diphosphatase [Paraoerskovia marina]
MESSLPSTPARDLPSTVDRAGERREEPGLVARCREDGTTRVVVVRSGAVLVDDDGGVLHAASELRDLPDDAERWVFLGLRVDDGAPLLAYRKNPDGEEHAPVEADAENWATVRGLVPSLDGGDAEVVLTAVALDNWHATHGRCPRCGTPTTVTHAGWVRRCVQDGSDHYPRTDPAVIMAVLDAEDRLLLGHAVRWPPGRFSTLAGYVEPGESLENAVRREVLEEVGVVVGDVVYRGSQPWPFPASLMLGFFARATTSALRPDRVEITEARWFTRPELLASVESGDVTLPTRSSIARALIEEWFGAALPGR